MHASTIAKTFPRLIPTATLLTLLLTFSSSARAEDRQLPLAFTGGHDLAPTDFGRPCNLIAAGIGVKPDQFREAFKNVHPAKGHSPSGDEQRKNKEQMMKVLRPLGVTNERLDEVANYYRFRPQDGELWPTQDAKGYAVVQDGKVTKVVITAAGSGYDTPPAVTLPDLPNVKLQATLSFDKDLTKNGAVLSVTIPPAAEH